MTHSSLPEPSSGLLHRHPPATLLTTLRHPMSIAMLASLGMHGLLAILLPLLPPTNPAAAEQRTVQLVELSPAEQLRLPQANAPITFPPLKPNNSNPITTSPYLLPPIGSSYRLNSDSSAIESASGNSTSVPDSPSTYSTGYLSQEFLDKLNQVLNEPVLTPATPKPTPTPTSTPTPSPPVTQPGPSGTASPTPTPSPTPTSGPTSSPATRSDKDALERWREQQRRIAAKASPTPTPSPVPGTATTEAEATGRLRTEIERIAKADNVDVDQLYGAIDGAPRDLPVKCPIAACTEKVQALQSAPAAWIIISPKGEITIASTTTGDPDLDAAIKTEAEAYAKRQPETDRYQVYLLRVQFQAQDEQA